MVTEDIKIRKCIRCGVEKPLTSFEGNRNTCKECRNLEYRERRKKQKQEDIVLYKCKQMSNSAYSRIYNRNRKTYSNLINPFGFENAVEMANFLYQNFYNEIKTLIDNGEVPSVDRIDTNYGYNKENIRILSHKENTELGLENRRRKVKLTCPNGEVKTFNSVVECAKFLGYTPKETSRISGWCKGKKGYKKPQGYEFEYAD